MVGFRKFHQGGGGRGSDYVFSHQCISQRVVRTSLEKQLDPMGPIVSLRVSITVFLRKTKANCDFSVASRPGSPTLDTPMIQLDSRLNVKLLMI